MIYQENPLAQAALANVEVASTAAGFDNVGTKDVDSLRALARLPVGVSGNLMVIQRS